MTMPTVSTAPGTALASTPQKSLSRTDEATPKRMAEMQKPGTEPAFSRTGPVEEQAGPVREEDLRDAVQRANQTIHMLRSELQFSVDEATGIDVVKFIDTESKEVIRQIPSEEMIAIARRLDELTGMLIRDKA